MTVAAATGAGRRGASGCIIDDVRKDIEKIRAHGGDVVFVRPPSAVARITQGNSASTLAGKDPGTGSLRETGSFGINFEDYPEMQGLEIPGDVAPIGRVGDALHARLRRRAT